MMVPMTSSTPWSPDDVWQATDRFAAALSDADAAAPVPACPGWTVHDLVSHLGNIHAWAAMIVATGEPAGLPDERPGTDELHGWYTKRAATLVDALAAGDPGAPCWTLARVDETRGFWRRRQLHETLMHLVDLGQAHGRATVLDPVTCADGVAETLEVFLPRLHARGLPADLARRVSLVATDTGHSWTLAPVDGSAPSVTDGAPVGDRVGGTAEQLLLRLWGRGDDVTVSGDTEMVGRFLGSKLSA
jgi:uncharacterized protein (TIGR03083 family)